MEPLFEKLCGLNFVVFFIIELDNLCGPTLAVLGFICLVVTMISSSNPLHGHPQIMTRIFLDWYGSIKQRTNVYTLTGLTLGGLWTGMDRPFPLTV
jgi:hypothetical protein